MFKFAISAGKIVTLLLGVALSTSVGAQEMPPLDVERDPNGVDLMSARIAPQPPGVSIPAAPELTFQKLGDFLPKLEGRMGTGGPTEVYGVSINAGSIASDFIACDEDGCYGEGTSGTRSDQEKRQPRSGSQIVSALANLAHSDPHT